MRSAQHGNERVSIELALVCGAEYAREDRLSGGAAPGPIAPAHLAGDDGRPQRLFRAPVGGVDSSRVEQEGEERWEFDGEMDRESLDVGQRPRLIETPIYAIQ